MENKYKILNGSTITIVNTIVEFTYDDGSIEEISIPHFNPKNDADIILGIENRFITEQEQRNNIVE